MGRRYVEVNDLDYNQHIGSFYGGYAFKHKSLTAKAGFRMEYTYNDGLSKSIEGDIPFNNKQFDVVPYVNITYMLKKGNVVSAAYTQRLNRPGIWYLNPYVNDSDPMNISYGNPDLKTVRRNSINLGYRKSSQKWNLGLNLSGDFTKSNIERISRVNESGVRISTYENIGRNSSFRLNVNYSYRYGDRSNLYINGSTAYMTVSSSELDLKNDGFSYNCGLGGSVGLWKKALFNFNVFVYGGDISLQSKYSVNYASSFGISQKIFKDKLSFSIYVNEPFTRKKVYSFDSQDPNYKLHSKSTTYQRSANFSLFWRFGKINVNVKKARRSSTDDKMNGGNSSAGGKM
ncbi:MAG: outer membrane beta-barrel family protein [Bacteroidales bacterium]